MTHQNPGRRRRSASGSHNIVTIRSHTPDTPPCCTKSHSSAAKKLRVTALYVAYGHAAATQLSNNASGRGHTDSTRARGVRVWLGSGTGSAGICGAPKWFVGRWWWWWWWWWWGGFEDAPSSKEGAPEVSLRFVGVSSAWRGAAWGGVRVRASHIPLTQCLVLRPSGSLRG